MRKRKRVKGRILLYSMMAKYMGEVWNVKGFRYSSVMEKMFIICI